MNPYADVTEATKNGESLLSLCCGVGFELANVNSGKITAVDIAPQYIDRLKESLPHVEAICADALEFIKGCADRSYDVISLIDAIEHLTKERGLELLKECQRVAKKEILVFTPEGLVRNEPHNAWGIEGADEHQQHLSGWTIPELEALGFELVSRIHGVTQHNDYYHALTMRWRCSA